MHHFIKKSVPVLFLLLCIVLVLASCGKNNPSPPGAPGGNTPLGADMTPEPGTDGRPLPQPHGHVEAMAASNGLIYAGSDNGVLYAFDAKSGSLRWQHTLQDTVAVQAVINGVVYAYADGDNRSLFVALNAGTGALLWHYQVADYSSQVMIDGGTLFISTAANTSSNTATLYALRLADGTLLWKATLRTVTPALLGVQQGLVFYGELSDFSPGFSEDVVTLKSSNGQVAWRARMDGADGYFAGVVASNNSAYLTTSHGAAYALRLSDGVLLWHVARPDSFSPVPMYAAPQIDANALYVISGGGKGIGQQTLTALRLSDGKLLWSRSGQGSPGPMLNQMQLQQGVIYVADQMRGMMAMRASDGAQLWQYTGNMTFGPVFDVNGLLYVNAPDGVFVLRAADGTLVWKRSVANYGDLTNNGSPIAVGEGVVSLGTDDGIVHTFDASSGSLLWNYAIQEKAVPSPVAYGAYLHFADSVSYQDALRMITDLGLKTFADCAFGGWVPQGESSGFSQFHQLEVTATVVSAPLWLARLQKLPGVTDVQIWGPHSCPMQRIDSSKPRYLGEDWSLTYARVTFSATTGYDKALGALDDLGFRLANPCYEQARAKGEKPTWTTMGQESAFAQAHTLLVATSYNNAVTWQQQLRAVSGVTQVEVPYSAGC